MAKLLTPAETADRLNCCVQTVYRNKNLPRAALPGVGVRFKESDLESFIEQNTIKAQVILGPPVSPLSVSLENLAEFDRMFLKSTKGESGSMSKKKTRWNYGFGSIYLRKTKQGNDRWYVDYQADGNRVREVVKNAQGRAEAVLYLKEKVAEAFHSIHSYTKPKIISFDKFSELYLENYSKPNKKSWECDYYALEAHLKPVFGKSPLNEIKPMKIEAYRAERLKSGKKKSTTNREMALLKKMFNLAIDWGYLTSNPAKKVQLFSEKDNLKEKVLSEIEEARLLQECVDHLEPIIVIATKTGMRKNEILTLTWDQVDLKRRQIQVIKTKSGKNRMIPINEALFKVLCRLRKQNKEEFVFVNTDTGKPFKTIRHSFEGACRRAGINNLRFQDLRHTFSSRLIQKGADIVTVQQLLGHHSVTITQRYTHTNSDQKKQAVGLLDQETPEKLLNLAHICHMDDQGQKRKSTTPLFSIN